MPVQVYLRADFKNIHAKPNSVPPTLEAVVGFSLNNSGSGVPLTLPDGAGAVFITTIVP